MDFLNIRVKSTGRGKFEVTPDFEIIDSEDLMVKNHSFYAFWNENKGEWSTKPGELIKAVDKELYRIWKEKAHEYDGSVSVAYMKDSSSGSIDRWNKYIDKQQYDVFQQLDSTIVFLDDPRERELYSSHRLSYNMECVPTPYYDKLFGTLYEPEELEKLEWALGSVIEGDSKYLQKLFVITGGPGKGKSTWLRLVENQLFKGYCESIDVNAIAQHTTFCYETIADNPLVAFQDEANLSQLQNNTGLNAIVAHEYVIVNTKNKKQYPQKFQTLIFIASNNDVNITDSRSGIIRRLVDVVPSGKTLPIREYNECKKMIKFELGGIAWKCHQKYLSDKHKYDNYIPTRMLRATNVVYSWLEETWQDFAEDDGFTVTQAWKSYSEYCDNGAIKWRLDRLQLRNELRGYFDEFIQDGYKDDGTRVRNYFYHFQTEKFAGKEKSENEVKKSETWIELKQQHSILDDCLADYPAQYTTDEGKPLQSWDIVETRLKELDTSKLHYVNSPEHLVIVDFDMRNEEGEKDLALNIEAASEWPETYAEVSQSGGGLHLHYIFNGDVSKLANIVKPGIEVKVYSGDSSLRRKVSLCNDKEIATLTSGLPLRKDVKKMVGKIQFENEAHLVALIMKQLRKETHNDTHQSVSMILKALDDAYESGIPYCVPMDLRQQIKEFCESSTNNATDCRRMYSKMRFESEGTIEVTGEEKPIVFFDIEVFPNKLFLVYKKPGQKCVRMLNPSPEEVEWFLTEHRVIGYNNRKYDNHILWGRSLGQTFEGCWRQSQQIIAGMAAENDKNVFFPSAYSVAYADVYDIATKKQSLKKWEIELHLPHKEMDVDWNKPLPDELDELTFQYCENDVEATEAVWNAIGSDVNARMMLAEWADMPICTKTNSLTAAIIFDGNQNKSRSALKWRDLSKPVPKWPNESMREFLQDECGRFKEPFDDKSVLPYFDGYKFDKEKRLSTYKGFEVGEGGFVYAEPGIHHNVALLDVESMHPNSFIDECYAGVNYTRRFKDILQLRVLIKHKLYEEASKLFNGIFAKHLENKSSAKALSFALKIAINSVYGLTSARFDNPFYNPENVDNIVAKRGALFMIDLLDYVQDLGYTVAHIKTDSIKIPNADKDIINKVIEFGHRYGYNFVHEATYEKMCLVNDAVYAAKYQTADWCMERYDYIPDDCQDHGGQWTATGTQFQVPYVFKTLFTHEPIIFDDMCETKSVTTSIWIDNDPDGEHDYQFVGKVGQFTPVKVGGGVLLRKAGPDKYSSVNGTKGYRWLESTDAEKLEPEMIDETYYISLADAAYKTIAKYGDVEDFVA